MVYARTLFPVFEPHEEGAVAGTGAGDEAVAGNPAIGFHFRNCANLGLHLIHNLIGLIQGGPRRRAHLHHEHALIFIGHQTAGHHLHEVDHATGGNHQENPGPRRCAHKLLHRAEILAGNRVVAHFIGFSGIVQERFLLLLHLLPLGPEEHHTKGWAKDKGRYGGQSH